MAEKMVLTCDNPGGGRPCSRPATRWHLWRDGERRSAQIDLCDAHAKALIALTEHAPSVPLPTKPRAQMELTPLRTTAATAVLKRK